MSSKVTIIDGVTVVNITPELSPEERKKRVREIAEGLIALAKQREQKREELTKLSRCSQNETS